MPYEDSNRGRVSYIAESQFGVTPTNPDFQIARITSSDLAASKQTTVSEELRADRMVSDAPEVAFSSGGTLNVEMSGGGTFDDFIEAVLGGTFSNVVNTTAAVTVVAATRNITCTGAFTSAVAGQRILISGMANAGNNGWFEIETVNTANDVTVLDPATSLTDETGPASAGVKGKMVRNGVVARSFSLEQAFLVNEIAQLFKGQRCGSWNMSVASGSIVTGSFGFMGTDVQAEDFTTNPSWLGSGSYVAATTTPVFNATANVGIILIDGAVSADCIQSIDFSLDNALREQMCVGAKFPQGIGYGRQTVTGTMNVFFEDTTFYTAMLNHSNIGLQWSFVGADGTSGFSIYLPKLIITNDNPALPGIDQDVVEPIEFQALAAAAGYQIQVDVA